MRATKLKVVLDALLAERPWASRMSADPIEFPHRYQDRADVEVVGLLSTALAYGRVDLFKPKIEHLLNSLGDHPARTIVDLDVDRAKSMLRGFVYRFNVATDVAVLLMGMGEILRRHGSLENAFVAVRSNDWRQSLSHFGRAIRSAAPEKELIGALGATRGLHHLLPLASSGAAKRMNLYLRWMVRGPDDIDFGLWSGISSRDLRIPLDTHVMRISRLLGLTARKTPGWAAVEEVTQALRALDPEDPIRYDFALCHLGMSGICPTQPQRSHCRVCVLKTECKVGRRVV